MRYLMEQKLFSLRRSAAKAQIRIAIIALKDLLKMMDQNKNVLPDSSQLQAAVDACIINGIQIGPAPQAPDASGFLEAGHPVTPGGDAFHPVNAPSNLGAAAPGPDLPLSGTGTVRPNVNQIRFGPE